MVFLDTDVMIDLLRQYPPAVAWLDSLESEEIVLPGFVAMELIQGCRDKTEQGEMDRELRAYSVDWPSPAACDDALFVFAGYHLSHGLGILDALIGQMAVAMNIPLYTFNKKHYSIIPNLKIVHPYEKS